ncbi:hypothetical protein [Rhizobium straminoryzae]|uniref:Minor tail protein n=1 Tax=Rhizobium straminoryzae TaxID=1387186 RepID=A0A549T0V1_9HYPH|nr:hypothetical protein [Rhizobium straminoryzae]TRL35491.1 hypothetical protein FNA46_20020 [Rhizobium straminoryzae]
MPDRSDDYQLPSWPPTPINRALWNGALGDIGARLRAREALEASFQNLMDQGVQASLDYIQATVAPQIANLQASISTAQRDLDQILIGGAFPNALKLGGQLPSYYATQQDLAAFQTTMSTALGERVPATRTINAKALTSDITLSKADVGLGQVDNTPDSAKPVSTPQSQALALKKNSATPFVDVAAAATVNLGAAGSPSVNITGTATITSFGTSAADGTEYLVRFAGASVITHSASLILPEGVNITAFTGMLMWVKKEGASTWRVIWTSSRLSQTGGGARRVTFDLSALTADRTITVPDTPVDLGSLTRIPGVAQTWKDMTASRVANTVYQNTEPRIIKVAPSASGSTAGQGVYVGETPASRIFITELGGGGYKSPIVDIPPWHYYEFRTPQLTYCAELRS